MQIYTGCFLDSNLKLFIASSIVSHLNFFDNLFSDMCVSNSLSVFCLFFVVFYLPVIPVSGPYHIVIFVCYCSGVSFALDACFMQFIICLVFVCTFLRCLLIAHDASLCSLSYVCLWVVSSGVSDCHILFFLLR